MSPGPTPTCSSCGARLATDQRYCLNCGTAVGSALASIRLALGPSAPAPRASAPVGRRRWWPRFSRGGAILAVCLGLGILFGALVTPNLQTLASPLIALGAPAPSSVAPASAPAAAALGAPEGASPSGNSGSGSGGNTGNGSGSTGNSGNTGNTGNTGNSGNTGNTGNTGTTTTTSTTSSTTTSPGGSQPVTLPPIKHVWLIVLSDQSFTSLFGKSSTDHYLNTTLVPQGTLLSNYYATSHGALADGIALLSGQGPTPEQQQGCPTFANVAPGSIDAGGAGQVHGRGCVLPAAVYTLPDQLTGNSLSWKAYVGGEHDAVAPAAGAAPATCRHPTVGAADPTAILADPVDGYLTRRNPFMYFHSIIDASTACAKTDVGFDQLATDLASGKVPSLSWIAPDPCAAGVIGGCPTPPPATSRTTASTTTTSPKTITVTSTTSTSSSSSSSADTTSSSSDSMGSGSSSTIGVPPRAADVVGPGPVDAFLQEWVPKIQATAAYKKDGMIVILSDQAPAAGPTADSRSCCGKLAYVNTTNPGSVAAPGLGGGRTGALVLSTYAGRGVTDATKVDHFTLLRTLDDIFNVPYLGYAIQRKDFDSVVFPSESGGDGAVSTRVQTGVVVITRTVTTAVTRAAVSTATAAGYAPLRTRPTFAVEPPPVAPLSSVPQLSPAPSFASRH